MKIWVRSDMNLVTNWYACGYEVVSFGYETVWLRTGLGH